MLSQQTDLTLLAVNPGSPFIRSVPDVSEDEVQVVLLTQAFVEHPSPPWGFSVRSRGLVRPEESYAFVSPVLLPA